MSSVAVAWNPVSSRRSFGMEFGEGVVSVLFLIKPAAYLGSAVDDEMGRPNSKT